MGKVLSSFKKIVLSKNVLSYFFLALLFVTLFANSGYALRNNESARSVINIVLLFVTFLSILALIMFTAIPLNIWKNKTTTKEFVIKNFVSNPAFVFLIYFLLLLILNFIFRFDYTRGTFNNYLFYCLITIFSFCFAKLVRYKTFKKSFKNIVLVLAIISIICHVPSYFLEQPYYFMSFSSVNGNRYDTFFGLYFQLLGTIDRNCGIFWEPALFSCILVAAILMEIVDYPGKKHLMMFAWKMMVLVFALLSTVSLSGIALFVIGVPFAVSFLKIQKRHKIITYVVLAIFVVAVALVVYFTPYLYSKIFYKNGSMMNRIYSLYINASVFKDRYFLGVGLNNVDSYYMQHAAPYSFVTAQTSTIGYWICAFGIPGILITLVPFVIYLVFIKQTVWQKILCTLFIIVFLNVEPFYNICFYYVMVFYILNGFKEHALIFRENEETSDTSLCIVLKHKIINSNSKAFINNSAGTFLVKGLAMLVGLFTTSAYLKYFGNKDVLGVWLVILQIIVFILTFDMGIGNGLKNKLIDAFNKKDNQRASNLISSAYISTFALTIIFIAVGVALTFVLDFNEVFNIDRSIIQNNQLKIVILIVYIAICLQLLLKLVGNIFDSLQKQFLSNSFALITNIALLIFSLIAIFDGAYSKLLFMAIFYLIASILPMIVSTIIVFKTSLKDIKLSLKSFSWSTSKEVMTLGGAFFAIQICLFGINSINTFIISQLYTAGSVPDYTCYSKIFNIVIVVASLISGPLWAIVAKAKSGGDINWIGKITSIIRKAVLALIFLDAIFILSLQLIFDVIFSNFGLTVNWLYSISFGFHSILMVLVLLESAISNGLTYIKPQLIASIVGVAIKAGLTVIQFVFFKGEQFVEYWYFTQLASLIALIPSAIIIPIFNRIHMKKIVLESSAKPVGETAK